MTSVCPYLHLLSTISEELCEILCCSEKAALEWVVSKLCSKQIATEVYKSKTLVNSPFTVDEVKCGENEIFYGYYAC